ncbi:DUF294 nucleotidyltransferase-like domain-containing protein [Microscilla marina]|uniref:Cyclic nucleotide-binding domain (CNMP-BD) protein n=1 Tax=Microscilla marina ATCC 23134 TaxID=313606 RepID=A1ZCF8_MICM2|nr:DUF294 nucleotidyltransferase-like domain-containing protein [Microscilla marina]EAY31960.1 cyclic nucleotide-binding domain (cNMP-BD) protein [Microscilla marina ATCC 23134]
MPSETIVQSVLDFLKTYPPFDQINPDELNELATQVNLNYFEVGDVLFREGDAPLPTVFVVKQGNIKLSRKQGEQEVLIDECDEGSVFGIRPLMANDRYLSTAIVAEKTLLYAIPIAAFAKVMESNSKVAMYFAAGFASGGITDNLKDMTKVKRMLALKDELPEAISLNDTDTLKINPAKQMVSCSPTHTVWEAAKIMSIFNVGSILVVNNENYPVGIITDSDFRRKVVARQETIKTNPVTEIMSSPVKTIKPNLSVSEIMLLMVNNKVTHFCVTKDGTDASPALGIISQRDLLIAQGNNPAVLAKQISVTNSVERLVAIRGKAEKLIWSYLQNEVAVPFISNIITEINDSLIRKATSLATQKLQEKGWVVPDLQYAFLSMGSEGRKEQLLRTDQDHAIVYENPPKGEEQKAKEYFLELGKEVTRILLKCGFDACPGHMMANNPKWNQPVAKWEKYFHKWISEPDHNSLMHVSIFFDFRPVAGDESLAKNLRSFIFNEIKKTNLFLPYLAKKALTNPPPLSFFRSFIVEKSGQHKNEFDIKARAMVPLIDAARVLAYEYQLPGFNSTFERFAQVASINQGLAPLCEAAAMGYEILMRHRAIQGLKNGNSGRYLNPNKFNKLERQTIRNIFKTIEKIQEVLDTRYRTGLLR